MFIEPTSRGRWQVVAPVSGKFTVIARFNSRQEAHNFLAGRIVRP